KERYKVPSFVLGISKESGEATGSGRSIKGGDLGRAVQAAVKAGIVKKGGGHAMAAGLSVVKDRIGDLRAFFEEKLAEETEHAQQNQSLKIDAALTASGATIALIEQIESAGPFGAANPAPIFAFPAHRVVYADIAGTDHVRCTLAAADGSRIKAIAFRVADTELGEILLTERAMPLNFAGRLAINDWGGRREPQLFIEDVARVK
ncbi:MAG TPA: single-stranded-DNA-specific exonuclease RecJ, partial [Rhizobiales bacterium]|nr:single-stranded-DNA-specific exonuclease RecJ [Hyphomicrobiales bacterium]